jgi:hypothetical protein
MTNSITPPQASEGVFYASDDYAGLLVRMIVVFIDLAVLVVSGWGLFRLKIVDLHGNTPSILRMTLRFATLFLGPLNLIFDLLWLGGDRDRQTLRDKLAGTYVVKRRATPLGQGAIVWPRYSLLGYMLILPEVRRDSSETR